MPGISKIQDIDEVMPVNEIIAEFFKGRESAAHILFQFWDMFYLAISSPDMDGMDNIERADIAYTFQNICVLIARLDKHRE